MEGENHSNRNDVWTPPESTQGPRYPQEVGVAFTSGAVSYAASVSSAYASSSATSTRVSAPNYSRLQYGAPYSQSRVQFPETYISASDPQSYQAPQSSYERISPVNEYRESREVPTGSDPISSYSGMQAEVSGMLAAPSVDSSTLGPGYVSHVVMNSDHQRVMTVQRVISPVDCTVSQSAINMANADQQHQQQTHTILAPVTSVPRYPVGHVTSMSSYSHSEAVSSTGGASLISHGHNGHLVEREQDNGISSITGPATQERRMVPSSTRKQTTHETISGEPDTTQDDGEEFQAVRNYMVDASPNLDDAELHSTMNQNHHPSSDLMDHNHQINSSHLSSNLHHPMARMDSVQDRPVVDSSGIASSSIVEGASSMMSVATLQRLGTSLVPNIDPDKDMSELEIMPTPSSSQIQVRKSSRIAELENETTHWHNRPTYNPKPYNPNSLWCEECMTTYEPSCPVHRLQVVPDKVVLSRAWASLPPMLQIFRLNEVSQYPPDQPHVGVFAKRPLAKLTQFGPYIGELVSNRENLGSVRFPLLLEKAGGDIVYFETSDENKCNWMMFVRPAESYAEQNMVAYQYGQDIYFSVTKNIEARGELKVWYASHYAERFGLQTLEITDQDLETLDQQEYKFQCYECSKRFKTSLTLQRHIIVSHESVGIAEESVEPSSSETPKGKSYASFSQGYLKRRGRPPKKDLDTTGYMWKKKSTSIYLNKTLKKYQRRHDPDAIRRTIQSLYRKKGKESGGQEWVCVHCDLTFDNSNLLNLHTLTHAAEDVGLDEVRKFAYGATDTSAVSDGVIFDDNVVSIDSSTLACPVCHAQFVEQRALIEHAAEHGTTKRRERPHKCEQCWKAFHTQETLQRHMLCHGDDESKPLRCDVCLKRFMNNSALSCHLKTHSDKKYYECPICHQGFDHTATMKEHVIEHAQDGMYSCPECQKQFSDFISLRKHIRGFHTNKEFPCPHCDKVFPRPDKLKLHMLRHSSHREFMCETCGRQFKRKDKLKEHIRRMHSLEREVKLAGKNKSSRKKFIPKVSPSDYHRFIYKCHTCMHGFKRRGMLVNHLAKRHPDVKPETVPELNLPILKTQKDYYCQYCEKVYKSSSKRKAHIIKNHPGADLPMSSRKKAMVPELPGLPNPTYSQTVGSITTMPHSCEFCHKQYASKAKLTQHQRKKHPFAVPPLPPKTNKDGQPVQTDQQQPTQDGMITQVVRYDQDTVIAIQPHPGQDGQPADLLTQAMSELTQSLQQEYRQMGEIQLQRVGPGTPTMVTVQTTPLQHSTIELSHLSQALPQGLTLAGPIQMAVATQNLPAAPSENEIPAAQVLTSQTVTVSQQQQQQQQQQSQQVINAPQTIVVSGAQGQTIPVSLATGFIQRAWNNFS